MADEFILDADGLIADESFQLDCDGLQYLAVPRRARRHDTAPGALRIPLQTLLTLLRMRTPHYTAQPYQQLAATYRAEGHARDARAVLIAQQQDLRASGQLGGPLTKTWHRISGLTIGYGYDQAEHYSAWCSPSSSPTASSSPPQQPATPHTPKADQPAPARPSST